MKLPILVFVVITTVSCSTFKPNHIDWKNAPENPTRYGPFGISTNHYNLKGDVKEAYRVVYIKNDTSYTSSLLLLTKFDKKGNLISMRNGLFFKLFDGETRYNYNSKNELMYQVRAPNDTFFFQKSVYNDNGELIPNISKTSILYDKKGNLIEKLRNGKRFSGVEYSYDKMNRVISKTIWKRDSTKRDAENYSYKKIGKNLEIKINYTNKEGNTEMTNKYFDKYGYRVGGINEDGSVTNTIVRDKKGNVIKDFCGNKKRYYVITYWDGTKSGYDPKLDQTIH